MVCTLVCTLGCRRLSLETIQLVASFSATFLNLGWSRVHNQIFDRLSILQLNFLTCAPSWRRQGLSTAPSGTVVEFS